MPPLHSSSQSDSANAVSETLAPPAETVRACTNRERRLTEYIRAHTGEDIAVRLTPHIQTACVIPTSEEALVESNNAEFSDEQARQLIESVDADYLVLISTHPANVDNLPITDQLTADRAQQFGYALHELGHIRYTAIADAAALLEERVDDEYQEFVHGLWNSCEDAAIENQLALDQSQLAADRLELVSRSISPHADGFSADDCCEFTFRDAIEAALYDEGIYDTGVRDALCDPDDERIVFADDADHQAFKQIEDSLTELVATVLSTPNSVERVKHVLDWWETVVKPLLDPSTQNQQESEQPDPAGVTGESNADAGNGSNDSSDSPTTERSTDEDADTNRSASKTGKQSEGDAADSVRKTDKSDSDGHNESATADGTDEPEESDEIAETAGSQSGQRPDPDAINTDQRQPSPGTDALNYPDIGGNEDADALDQSESDGEGESEPESVDEEVSESQSPREPIDNTQTSERGRDAESDLDTADDTPPDTDTGTVAGDTGAGDGDAGRENTDTVGGSDNDTGSNLERDAGGTTDSDTDAGSHGKTAGSDDERASPENSSSADQGDTTDSADESDEQDSGSEPEGTESEFQPHENPWGTSNSTGQVTLGSFSTENTPSKSDMNSSESNETPANEPETNRDDSSTDAGDVGKPESESKSDKSDTGDTTTDAGNESSSEERASTEGGHNSEEVGDEEPTESSDVGSSIGNESGDREEGATSDSRKTNENDSTPTGSDGDKGRGDTPTENTSESDEQPPESTPVHETGDDGLDSEGALNTDREAAHDEAERATPDEDALKRDLEDVADALDALAEQDGGGAAPGSLSELSIMPDTGGSSTADTVERWGAAAADAEFVADALRKALKESRRDTHRSGVTSGTFDRQRAGALARGDVGAFHVRQPGDDKQYDLVIILDRSGSMRRHIQTAENALVRFALACEDIGINVGVIDFTQEEARLVKPFSVGCEHVRASLFSKQVGGGTPLTDALGLSRELLEQRRNSPLVLIVSDGKPGDEDTYHDELAQSYAPICGLTLVLDQPSGSVPEKVSRNERFYDRHVYVHEPGQLADRLDQFAVMFDGL